MNATLDTKHSTQEPTPRSLGRLRVLLVVEGSNDIEFLRRISRMLHKHDRSLPDLAHWEQCEELIFVPFGGGKVSDWSSRLAPVCKPEFHLYDREVAPESELRRAAARRVNCRAGCRAVVTGKRSLENYLHPLAISAVSNVRVVFGDSECVADVVARRCHEKGQRDTPWAELPVRTRRRYVYRAKQWLNTQAVDRMTVDLLREQDPQGDIISWLRTIQRLADGE